MILALAGGVGGAKLAAGLAGVLPPEELTVVVNTGDDFEHLGLHISPDLDTVMYNLAGRHNPDTGWGVAGESWQFMQALRELGGEDWFALGDRDLAVHVARTQRLRKGVSLSRITQDFCRALGILPCVAPMSDDPVRTVVCTDQGNLAFQDYFVRRRCEPKVERIVFEGAAKARPSDTLARCLKSETLRAVVICPSNPFLSIAPMLAIPGVAEQLATIEAEVVAVSPIVAGQALKGPAAKLLRELGQEVSATAIAMHYRHIVDALFIDTLDVDLASEVERLGIRCGVLDTIMRTGEDKTRLARQILDSLKT